MSGQPGATCPDYEDEALRLAAGRGFCRTLSRKRQDGDEFVVDSVEAPAGHVVLAFGEADQEGEVAQAIDASREQRRDFVPSTARDPSLTRCFAAATACARATSGRPCSLPPSKVTLMNTEGGRMT